MSRDIEMRKLAVEEQESLLENGSPDRIVAAVAPLPEPTIFQTTMDFLFCAGSLQVSYILWGLMQEMIMSTKFQPTPSTPDGLFPSATFCVFSNRFLAIIVSLICCLWIKGTTTCAAPLLAFTPCALSNTISSWGQYQALVFVSFSLQTIFKSMKIIPVMLMGTILKGTTYKTVDYVEAAGITVGILIFSVSKSNFVSTSLIAQLLGFGCLCAYIVADSFTSQWQSRLYRDYGKIEHYQMMFGVNVSAIALTTLALVVSGEIPIIVEFLIYNPDAIWYNVITAVCSTTGQFAIFYTIKRFGPEVFTIIMTTRQMASIVISNYIFGHSMSMQSYLGAAVVFGVLGYSIYRKIKEKQGKDAAASAPKANSPTRL